METSRPRFKYELIVVVLILAAAAILWFLRTVGNPFATSKPLAEPRQALSTPSVLELPPSAPVPAYPHVFVTHPGEADETSDASKDDKAKKIASIKHQVKIPTRYEIMNKYRQVIEIDFKDLQIAMESDRYGYKNQAVIYYKKYLEISPSGPYSNQVRSRLSQLEGSP